MSAANPTSASLWTGRIFTTLVFALALAGVIDAIFGNGGRMAVNFFIAAAVVYSVGALILYLRKDYILRLFGCSWPLFLPKVDELQLLQRQRAFASTFAGFIAIFSFGVGAQIGAMVMEIYRDEPRVGLIPSDPAVMLLILIFILLCLTLAPQAYLAWTLKPLDEEDAA